MSDAIRASVAAAGLLLAGCGSGSGSGGATYARLAFPPVGPRAARMDVVPAFPALRFSAPVFATHAPDGSDRVFVVEQAGRIFVFRNDPAVTQARLFLDIRARVTASGGEEGLLGLAFDPDHATNGRFIVHYTTAVPHQSVIARYLVTSDPDAADPASEAILLTVAQPFANHNGGMLAFGPDRMLYVGFGDGGSGGDPFGHGQNTGTLLGSLLRIDVRQGSSYVVPPDNPLVGTPGARGEIWAWGLRNPWRFSFDRDTGELWLGDVGQLMREEIDRIVEGGNYGWNVFEGDQPYRNPQNLPPSAFRRPILAYDRSEGACVIGGYVYRGAALPELHGAYVYGDYASGRIWALVSRNDVLQSNTEIGALGALTSFGEDARGELLLVSHSGTLHRLQRRGAASPAFPLRLSQTGLFTDLATLAPAAGVIPYEVNAPFWSDGAVKRRWLALTGGVAEFAAEQAFRLPPGAVLVKHFELELRAGDPSSRRRLETRVLVHETGGWAGYTYKWNAAQTDAELLGARTDETFTIQDPGAPGGSRSQTWTYPGRSDCLQCHDAAAGTLLGIQSRQLTRDIQTGSQRKNQLRHWRDLGLLRGLVEPVEAYPAFPDPADPSAPLQDRARAYLAVNCAQCHLPGGRTPTDIDLRVTTADADLRLFSVRPTHGDLGLPDAWRIAPGRKEASVLWERMRRLDGTRMPPLGSNEVDANGVRLLGEWIDRR